MRTTREQELFLEAQNWTGAFADDFFNCFCTPPRTTTNTATSAPTTSGTTVLVNGQRVTIPTFTSIRTTPIATAIATTPPRTTQPAVNINVAQPTMAMPRTATTTTAPRTAANTATPGIVPPRMVATTTTAVPRPVATTMVNQNVLDQIRNADQVNGVLVTNPAPRTPSTAVNPPFTRETITEQQIIDAVNNINPNPPTSFFPGVPTTINSNPNTPITSGSGSGSASGNTTPTGATADIKTTTSKAGGIFLGLVVVGFIVSQLTKKKKTTQKVVNAEL